jgi:hypothetical protein
MKSVVFIVFLLFFVGCSTARIKHSDDGKTYIPFDETTILAWDDFKGTPSISNQEHGKLTIDLVLEQGTNIWWGYQYFEAHGIVFPFQSWIKNEFKSESYLEYFKTKFMIAELYALKLLHYLDVNEIKHENHNEITNIFERFNKEMIDRIDQYENDTNFGGNIKNLKEWTLRIEKEYNELKNL